MKMIGMNAIVGCEYSAIMRDALTARGWNAASCDLLPSEADHGVHHQMDLFAHIESLPPFFYDLAIIHPPCTFLAHSGVQWLHSEPGRWEKMIQAARFFRRCWDLRSRVRRLMLENPVPHGYAIKEIGVRYHQKIQPWMFGHPEQKGTCLWLHNLPRLRPTNNVRAEMMRLDPKVRNRMHMMPDTKDRWKERSRTYTGIAAAIADQFTKPFITQTSIFES